jgi:hypothetical protein
MLQVFLLCPQRARLPRQVKRPVAAVDVAVGAVGAAAAAAVLPRPKALRLRQLVC